MPNQTKLAMDGTQEANGLTVHADGSALILQLTDEEVKSNPSFSGVYECFIETFSGDTESVFIGLYRESEVGKTIYYTS